MLTRFLSDRNGVSAVEFALLLPLMLLFYFGTVETGAALAVHRKVVSTASTIADLVAQDTSIDDTESTAIFTAAEAIMAPYDPMETIQVVVSSVRLTGTEPRVVWSDANAAATARGVGSLVENMPAGLLSGTNTVIMAEVDFPHVGPSAEVIGGAISMEQVFYLRPRQVISVCRVRGGTPPVNIC